MKMDVYNPQGHHLLKLDEFRKQKRYCDVAIITGTDNRQYHLCHSLALVSSIPYFDFMFGVELKETNVNEVNIPGLDSVGFEHILDYVYRGKIKLTLANVKQVIAAAWFLDIRHISDQCLFFLTEVMSVETVFNIRTFALSLGGYDLLERANEFIRKNFAKCSKSLGFLYLSFEHLQDLITSDELVIQKEELIYKAVMRWTYYNLEEREQYLSELIRLIRFPLMNRLFITGKVVCNELIARSNEYLKMIIRNSLYPDVVTDAVFNTLPRARENYIYVTGLDNDNRVVVTRTDGMHWMKMPASQMESYVTVTVASLKQKLYLLSYSRLMETNSFKCVHSCSNKWVYLSKPPVPLTQRCVTATMEASDVIYYHCSKATEEEYTSCIYGYLADINDWEQVKTSDRPRYRPCMTTLGSRLVVLGGVGESGIQQKHAEYYDPRVGHWSPMAPMLQGRYDAAAAVLNGNLYVAGGYMSNSVELYETRMNKWINVTPMLRPRCHFNLVAYNNKIWALGGPDLSTEVYSDITNSWCEGPGITTLKPYSETSAIMC